MNANIKKMLKEVSVPKTLLLDGDIIMYKAASSNDQIGNALFDAQKMVLSTIFKTHCKDAIVFLSAKNCKKLNRKKIKSVKPYQYNRQDKEKPLLLDQLKVVFSDKNNILDNYKVVVTKNIEADDAIIIESYKLKDKGIVYSVDKDLRQTGNSYYDIDKCNVFDNIGFGKLERRYSSGGELKVGGYGRIIFWLQMLCGDQADGIVGLKTLNNKRCGIVSAYNFIESLIEPDGTYNESKIADAVISKYREIDQNAICEGWLLWLLRDIKDTVIKYFYEVLKDKDNIEFIKKCEKEEWHE